MLTVAEYRLALLGLVDFEGAWDVLAVAASFVVDGAAKQALLQDRILSLGADLAPLAEHVDVIELLMARHWFRTEPCVLPDPTPEEPVA